MFTKINVHIKYIKKSLSYKLIIFFGLEFSTHIYFKIYCKNVDGFHIQKFERAYNTYCDLHTLFSNINSYCDMSIF